jgi:hypothetical protein
VTLLGRWGNHGNQTSNTNVGILGDITFPFMYIYKTEVDIPLQTPTFIEFPVSPPHMHLYTKAAEFAVAINMTGDTLTSRARLRQNTKFATMAMFTMPCCYQGVN